MRVQVGSVNESVPPADERALTPRAARLNIRRATRLPWERQTMSNTMHFKVSPLLLRLALALCVAGVLPAVPPAQAAKPADDATAVAALAKQRFKEGQFEIAARLFVRAYEMSRRPALLFNAARAREAEGNKDSALRLYRTYVEIEKDVAGREEARVRITVLEEAGAHDDTRPPPAEDGKKKDAPAKDDAPSKSDVAEKVAQEVGSGGGQVDKLVPFQASGTHKLGLKVGRIVFEEIVLRNMPTAKDVEESRKDTGDKSHPKITVGYSNPSGGEAEVKMKASQETASGEVLMSCNTSETVKAGVHNDHSNLCWIAGLKTLDWPKMTRLHLVASVVPKK